MKTSHKSTVHTAGHRDGFPTLAFSPDGTKLASVGADGRTIFEIISGHPFSTWRADHLVRLTDVRTGHELSTLEFSGGIEHLTFSPDGKTVAFGSLGEIHLWHTETGDKLTIPLVDWAADIRNMPLITALAFSPDGTTLVSGTNQGKIQTWNVATGKALAVVAKPTAQENLGHISVLSFSPDGALLAAGSHSQIDLWEVNTGNKLLSVNTKHKQGNMGFQSYSEPLVFSPDGAILVNGLQHGAIQLWDITTGDRIAVLDDIHKKWKRWYFHRMVQRLSAPPRMAQSSCGIGMKPSQIHPKANNGKQIAEEVITCGLQVFASLSLILFVLPHTSPISITLLLPLNLCYNSTNRKKHLQDLLTSLLQQNGISTLWT